MNPDAKITLALTHWNRFGFLMECVSYVLEDPRISEIVISDDASTDGSYEKLKKFLGPYKKVKLYRNEKNQDCFRNKKIAVEHSSNEWVILFDSDNVLQQDYLDTIYNIPEWQKDCAYLPTFAMPHFDYREFDDCIFDRTNIAPHIGYRKLQTALNTCNYFINRNTYLAVWDGSVDPVTADSIWVNFNWLRLNKKLVFVKGLKYFHRVHDESHYKQNMRRTGGFMAEVITRLGRLRKRTLPPHEIR